MSNSRTLLCMFVAVALGVGIAFSWFRFAELRDSEASLGAALGGSGDEAAALAALAALDGARLSEAQARRRDDAFREALERRLRSRPPLTQIGSQAYDPCRREPWRFSSGTKVVTVTATLDSPALARWIKTLVVGSAEAVAFTGSPPAAHAQVPLAGAGRQKEVAIAFGVSFPGRNDVATVTLPEPLVLHQDDRKPRIEARTIEGAVAAGEEPVARVLGAGEAFSVEVRDEAGLVLLAWSVDGQGGEERIPADPPARAYSVPLPEGLTAGNRRRVAEVVVRAENASGNRAAATFRLDIRPKNWHPVRRLLVDGSPIDPARTQIVRGPRVRVRLDVDPEFLDEALGLGLKVDGKDYRPAVAEGGLEADVDLSEDKPSGILLVRGTSVLDHWTVQADGTPPSILVHGDDGIEVPPGDVEAPAGAKYRIEISDPGGVAEGEQAIRIEGLARDGRDVAPDRLEIALRLPDRGPASLGIRARDRLGNETAERIWNFTAVEPLALTKSLLDGRVPGGGRVATRRSSAVLEVRGTPGGRLDVVLGLAGGPAAALRAERVVLGGDGAARAEIDLSAGASPERGRVLSLRREDGTALAEFEIRLDVEPPTLAVRGLAPAAGEAGAFEGEPGAEYEIVAGDDDAVASIAVDDGGGGGDGAAGAGGGHVVRAATVPATLPAEVRARAVDLAGNEGTLTFRILPPDPPSAPERLPVPEELRWRLAAARDAVRGNPVTPAILKEIDAIELQAAGLPATDPEALRAFRSELEDLKKAAREPVLARPIPENLPERLPNPAGGSDLVLIRPAPGGPEFRPFWIGSTEVTVGMFTIFLEERGADAAWWAETLAGFPNPGGGTPDPESHRKTAGILTESRHGRKRPVRGASAEIAYAFAVWFGTRLKDAPGTAGIPTLREWRLAAGEAGHPDAVYPTTGAFPDGTKLRDRSCIGALGGAAIGGTPTTEVPDAGSYAPGVFGLYDMAGSAWEWVLGPDDRPMAIGGGLSSSAEECRLDAPLRIVSAQQRGSVGIRVVVRP